VASSALSFLGAVLGSLVHVALILAAAPLLTGLVRRTKARLQGRVGPPLLQPFRDLRKLVAKTRIEADSASPLFRLAPLLGFAFVLLAASLVPSFASGLAFEPLADLLVITGLLATARVIQALAAMDVGTAFGGLGAAREMTFAALAEPAMILSALSVALIGGTTNLSGLAEAFATGQHGLRVSLLLCLLAMIAVAVAENARVPVDNPATHLELTMVHEAMVLEYSGADLALVEANSMLRLALWASLLIAIFLPFGIAERDAGPLAWGIGAALWASKVALAGIVLAVGETLVAKMRVFRVPEFLGAGFLLALLAAVFLFVARGLA